MTGTIAQVRPADERLAERLAEEYRQARIDMGPREAAAEWFTPLLRKWRRLLAGKGEGFTAREQLALAVKLDADLRSRDTLIVTAISPEVSMKQLRVMVEERYSLKSTALLERVLEGWFHAGQKPDTSRLDLAVDILAGFVERVPQSRRAQLLTVCAYLSWSAGHVGRAAEWGGAQGPAGGRGMHAGRPRGHGLRARNAARLGALNNDMIPAGRRARPAASHFNHSDNSFSKGNPSWKPQTPSPPSMKPPALRQPPAGWSCSKRRLSTRIRRIPAATWAMWASWLIPSAPKASDRTCWSCPRRRDGSRWSSAIGGWRPRNWRDWNGFRRSWPSWTNGNSAS